jgi:hypothetical protein
LYYCFNDKYWFFILLFLWMYFFCSTLSVVLILYLAFELLSKHINKINWI